jgi:ATP-dependent DNA helicase RecG
MLDLTTSVQYVKGVGPRIGEILANKGIHTVDDLLHYLPFRYEDRLNPRGIAELRAGEMATVIAEVRTSGLFRTRRMPIFQMTAGQGRARLKCIWFNGSYLRDKFKPGQLLALYGKVEEDNRSGELQLIQPQFEILDDATDESDGNGAKAAEEKVASSLEIGRIVPIYESAGQGKLTTRWFRRIIHTALENLTPDMPDPIPRAVRQHLSLIPPREAINKVHWPDVGESLEALQTARTPAHMRLIFEELFFVELGLELKRREQKAQTGIAFKLDVQARNAIKRILPFHPTAAQKRALKEIAGDMEKPYPMRRLLQGDVGSGKTIVAFEAAIIAIENGYQVALMAPTEILAQQHYFSARKILENAGYRIVLLTGSLESGRKRDVRRHISQGNAQLVIGTHALIEQAVEFDNLGLVIVDEQHRFGVMQRFKLMKKSGEGSQQERSAEPDVLVMTATPIPRTLALTLYGDLDVSVIDELPPGRTPIVTRRIGDDQAEEVWKFVRKQIAAGHQAYVVYPVIEENEENELKAAIQMHRLLREKIFPDRHVGLLHGRMPTEEKEKVMRDGHRSWRRRRQCHRHGHRARRTVRTLAVAPASRTHRPRRREILLRSHDRRQSVRRWRTPSRCHGQNQRRLSDRRARSRTARAWRILRHSPGRRAQLSRRQSHSRSTVARGREARSCRRPGRSQHGGLRRRNFARPVLHAHPLAKDIWLGRGRVIHASASYVMRRGERSERASIGLEKWCEYPLKVLIPLTRPWGIPLQGIDSKSI